MLNSLQWIGQSFACSSSTEKQLSDPTRQQCWLRTLSPVWLTVAWPVLLPALRVVRPQPQTAVPTSLQFSQVPRSQHSFFSCHNAVYGIKHLFGWSGSAWATQVVTEVLMMPISPEASLWFSCLLRRFLTSFAYFLSMCQGLHKSLEIWGVIIMSQTILWCLNFLEYLGIQHSQDSCLKESLLKQDHIQWHLLGLVGRGMAEKPSWFKKCVPVFWAFWSIYCFLMFCDATNCIVFFFPGCQVLKCSRIRQFTRVGLRRASYCF